MQFRLVMFSPPSQSPFFFLSIYFPIHLCKKHACGYVISDIMWKPALCAICVVTGPDVGLKPDEQASRTGKALASWDPE